MVVFPGTKLNLGLNVVAKRADGFHDLESCFYPLPYTDLVEVMPAATTTLHETGLPSGVPAEQNLVWRAWQLLHSRYGIGPVDIYLHKVVPTGAGLGGGSADAVATLKACVATFGLSIGQEEMLELAAVLGSDCPFFVANAAAWVTGRGEVLQQMDISLAGYHIMVAHPGVGVSTAQAFASITPKRPAISIREVLAQPIELWQGLLVNDFEAGIVAQLPIIGQLKDAMRAGGAVYASMTGSGSAVFGLFRSKPNLDLQAAHVWQGQLA